MARVIKVVMVCLRCGARVTISTGEGESYVVVHADDQLRAMGWSWSDTHCRCPACEKSVTETKTLSASVDTDAEY